MLWTVKFSHLLIIIGNLQSDFRNSKGFTFELKEKKKRKNAQIYKHTKHKKLTNIFIQSMAKTTSNI